MNADTFNLHLAYMQNLTVETLAAKAKEYADASDRLHNFKIAGPLLHRTPIGALGGFMAKHTTSIYDMVAGSDRGETYPPEMWEEKIKDHINYLFLLWGLVNERDEVVEALDVAIEALREKAEQSAKPVEEPDAPAKPKRQYNRKPATVNPDFEAAVVEMEAEIKATAPKPSEAEELGKIESAKLRRKAQSALRTYCEKHGYTDLRPVIRATGNRVTEGTLRGMLTDSSAFEAKHWLAVDAALKKLALAEIKQEAQ